MNSKCGVQSKRRCESHESCVCIVFDISCVSPYRVDSGSAIARAEELVGSVWGTVSLVFIFSLNSVTGSVPLYRIIVRCCYEMS